MNPGAPRLGAPLIADLGDLSPRIDKTAFIAPGAIVIGDVVIGAHSSVWYGCVLRGDEEAIEVGEFTNIQDGVIIHTTVGEGRTVIGSRVTIGHRAMLHGCRIEDGSMIGIGAIVLDGTVVESGAMVAAGAMVAPGKTVASGQLWGGCPARYLRDLKPGEIEFLRDNPEHYRSQAQRHRLVGSAKDTGG